MTTDEIITTIGVGTLALHVGVGIAAYRSPRRLRSLPALNALVGALLAALGLNATVESLRLGYSADLAGLIAAGYGSLVFTLSLAHLLRGIGPRGLQASILGVHTLILGAATYLFATFEMTRLW